MSVFDWFRRKRRARPDEGALELSADKADLWNGEGSGNPLAPELARRRWMINVEGLNTAQSGIDPGTWENGRVAFASERSIAFDHEVLRGQLRDRVAALCRDQMKALFSRARQVAQARDQLALAEEKLLEVQPEVAATRKAVESDPRELRRYHHTHSIKRKVARRSIDALLVVSEFVMSSLIFNNAFKKKPFLGAEWMLAAGILVLLIVIPHYVAQGLKDGLTRYHKFDLDPYDENDHAGGPGLRRSVHFERLDDNVFRLASFFLAIVLGVLAVPLSVIRMEEMNGRHLWYFLFFLFLQLGISGYFFLVEWLDHGLASSLRKAAEDRRDDLESDWTYAREDVGKAVAAFHELAEDLIFTIRQAPTWDREVVASYYAGMWSGRAVMEQASEGLDRFVHQGQYPALEAVAESELDTGAADPLTREMPRLGSEDAFGRDWWMDLANDALRIEDADHDSDAVPQAKASWIVSKSPAEMLRWFLRTYFDMALEYRAPSGLMEESDAAAADAPPVGENGHGDLEDGTLAEFAVEDGGKVEPDGEAVEAGGAEAPVAGGSEAK